MEGVLESHWTRARVCWNCPEVRILHLKLLPGVPSTGLPPATRLLPQVRSMGREAAAVPARYLGVSSKQVSCLSEEEEEEEEEECGGFPRVSTFLFLETRCERERRTFGVRARFSRLASLISTRRGSSRREDKTKKKTQFHHGERVRERTYASMDV